MQDHLQCDYCSRGHLHKVDQSEYRKITIDTFQESWLWANQQLIKNNMLLEAQNLNNDNKLFSRRQNVSKDDVCVFKTLHITPRGNFCLTQVGILSSTSNVITTIAEL